MTNTTTPRGFQLVTHEPYPPDDSEKATRLVQQSSLIGDQPGDFLAPGSSFLWIGQHHHLSRDEVAKLVVRLSHWLITGRLFDPVKVEEPANAAPQAG